MFSRKSPPELTNEGYARWLRAQRPPLPWFLALSVLEQETLAGLGDEYLQDFAVAVGYAVTDPQAADDGISAAGGDTQAEESLLRRLAAGFVQKIQTAREPEQAPLETPDVRPSETLSGFGERRTETHTTSGGARSAPKLFGVDPGVREVAP